MLNRAFSNEVFIMKRKILLNDIAMKKKSSTTTPVPDDSGHIGLQWIGDHPVPAKPTVDDDEINWDMVTGQSGG